MYTLHNFLLFVYNVFSVCYNYYVRSTTSISEFISYFRKRGHAIVLIKSITSFERINKNINTKYPFCDRVTVFLFARYKEASSIAVVVLLRLVKSWKRRNLNSKLACK